ncbi:large conductance mechanosensitive channel protein MscL [Humibacter ginsenosidimutans]|uniref:Large-conductance mechanosensitive channel n=1 Tax=Humibacter ginsenosidimutans TaxID=2599293 RepID=A0A5B8M436_9MICO|nr:large conductance mechanosensitive channel protein MscL [Humibacter ginsenosidimutans]QDZ14704.1 large conductance mechanosensitive channel protein MscL [Humibacter ginsenosidimutans]
MIKGFKEFIMRGNVIDLAVAVVIGAAFTAVVNAIVASLINPLISAVFKADSLDKALKVPIPTVGGGTTYLAFGAIIGAVIQFLAVALVVYFVFVLPMNHFRERAEAKRAVTAGDEAEALPADVELLTQIRDLLAAQADANLLDAARSEAAGGRHSDAPPSE